MMKTIDLKNSVRRGLTLGIVTLFLAVAGMFVVFAERSIVSGISLSNLKHLVVPGEWLAPSQGGFNLSFSHLILIFIGIMAGMTVSKLEPGVKKDAGIIVNGVIAGAVTGAFVGMFIIILSRFDLGEMRNTLPNITIDFFRQMTFNPDLKASERMSGAVSGAVLLTVLGALTATLGVATRFIPERPREVLLWTLGVVSLIGLLWEPIVNLQLIQWIIGPDKVTSNTMTLSMAIVLVVVFALIRTYRGSVQEAFSKKYRELPAAQGSLVRNGGYLLLIVITLLLPYAIGGYWTRILGFVGLYALMGLGLNIVVGLAGLLDLGYVAFYAIGAYTCAMLTSSGEGVGPGWPFWAAWPVSMLAGAVSGIVLGFPVLRMRGDYLAIVTLGFGEIIRVLALSDVLKPWLHGPQGIMEIPTPTVPWSGESFVEPRQFYWLVAAGVLIVAFISMRLTHSRVGRAWEAMREDEDVAQAVGINTTNYKLLAFSAGASFAGIGGAIFAAWQRAIFPMDFSLFVSINVLCLIIIGGIGSIPGVILGALVLVGLPEVLREMKEYRILAYGALLVIMMLVRPEGLWPSRRQRMEAMVEATVETAGEEGGKA